MKSDESHIWESFKAGDRIAFKMIYEQYIDVLLNYGYKVTSDKDLLKDSVHDLFVELWNSREKLSSTTSIKFYLFKALRNKICRNKSKSHEDDRLPLDTFMKVLTNTPLEDDQVEAETKTIQINYLKGALEKLPARQREAISLRYFHNFSNEEMAEIMGVNYQSACKFIYAALKNLKEYMKVAVAIGLIILATI